MRRSATRRGTKTIDRAAVDRSVDYLLKYRPYLRHDEDLAAGLPIASDVIEGACRHLVRDRMDITGAGWVLESAKAVLKLRSLRVNADFEAYWAFHVSAQRLVGPGAQLLGGVEGPKALVGARGNAPFSSV